MMAFVRTLRTVLLGTSLGVAWLLPASVAAITVTDTSVADFDSGTPGVCYIAETADGEVLLAPTDGQEFSDPNNL